MSLLKSTTNLLEKQWVNNWTTTTFSVENKKHKRSTTADSAHLQILYGDAFNKFRCSDGVTFKQSGTVRVELFVLINKGSQRAYELADLARGVFSNKIISHINLTMGAISAPFTEGNYYRISVSIPFSYEDKI
jgi:hypothetical protein